MCVSVAVLDEMQFALCQRNACFQTHTSFGLFEWIEKIIFWKIIRIYVWNVLKSEIEKICYYRMYLNFVVKTSNVGFIRFLSISNEK